MTKAVKVYEPGGPEVMKLEDVILEPPGPGMATVANRAIGVNYIDTYHRSGLYPLPLPTGIGMEAAGVVEAVGEGADLEVGDRVAYCSAGFGAYSEAINLPAERLVKLPEGIDFERAAASLLKGQTVEYLLQRTYPLQAGDTCLFPPLRAGWACFRPVGGEYRRHGYRHCGVGEKAALAKTRLPTSSTIAGECGGARAGDHRRRQAAGGLRRRRRDTFDVSLDCLRPRGLMVSFGNASGAPDPLDLQVLAPRGPCTLPAPP